MHSSINRLQTMGFLNFCVGYIVTTDWRSLKRGVLFKPFERNSRVAYGAFFSRSFLFILLSHSMNDIDTENCCLHYGFAVKEYD